MEIRSQNKTSVLMELLCFNCHSFVSSGAVSARVAGAPCLVCAVKLSERLIELTYG